MKSIFTKIVHQLIFRLYLLKKSKWMESHKIQWSSKHDIETLKLKKLKYILHHAVNHVPFYYALKEKINFDEFSIEELYKFPIIDKSIIRANFRSFLSTKNSGILSKTSGTSGEPFKYYLPFNSWAKEKITYSRAWGMGKEYKYKVGDPVVMLRTYTPGPGDPIWCYNKKDNFYYLSAFHINKDNLTLYVNIIERSKSKLLRGYGSSIYIFTLLLKEHNIRLSNINTIITSSEMLLSYQRELIEEHFGVKVLDWYGQNENTVTVQQCWAGNYHNNDDYGILEIDDNREIIATSLNNDVMPFIRYNTKDKAIKLDTDIEECSCGRKLSIPFKGIEGRSDDILIKKDGTLVPTANFSTLMKTFDLIDQYQIIQHENRDLTLKLISRTEDSKYFELIRKEYESRLGNIPIKIELVKEIKRDLKTGKLKVSIQEGKI